MVNVDRLDHPIVLTMVDSGRDIAALLDEADLVEWGEKIDRLIPESFMMSLVQR